MSLESQAKALTPKLWDFYFWRRSILFSGFPVDYTVHLMEISTLRSLTEMGMDHSFLHQWQMGSLDELCPLSMAAAFNENYYDMQLSSIPMFNQEQPPSNLFETEFNKPSKQQKTNSWGSSITAEQLFNSTSPSSVDTHFAESNYPNNVMKPKVEIDFSSVAMNYTRDVIVSPGSRGTKRDRSSTSPKLANAQAQDHVMAERRRREKLSQKFIALSALVPGLKRMDKATVLGDAIKYLKTLQERVNHLEEENKKQKMESVVFVKKHQLGGGDRYNNSSSDEDLSNAEAITEPLPEIEARFSGKDVLIRIHCLKRKRILDKVVAEIERLPLSVINSSAMSFGNSALDITIIAEMEEGFNMSIKDFVKNLDSQLQSIIRKRSKQEDTSLD